MFSFTEHHGSSELVSGFVAIVRAGIGQKTGIQLVESDTVMIEMDRDS